MGDDLTLEILKQIRDPVVNSSTELRNEFHELRGEFRELRKDFNSRLDQTNGRLERVEQGLTDLGQFMRRIALDQARHERFHSEHVVVLEQDLDDVKKRLRRLEERVGP